MGAGFQHKNPVAVLQAGDMRRAFHVMGEVPFVAGEDDAEAGQGYLRRNLPGNDAKNLAVGDDQVRTDGCPGKECGDFFGLQHDAHAVVVENIP